MEGPALVDGSISNTGRRTNVRESQVQEPLVLASTSPWRRRMLESAGVRIRAVGSGVDERALEQAILAREPGPDAPRRIAAALAGAKARAVAALHPGSWVLAADQVGQDPAGPERPIGKSSGAADHLLQLRALVGRRHDLLTAWVLLGPAGERAEGVCTSSLWMRGDLTDDELAAYVATGEGSECAGGYAIEGLGSFLFERVEGDWNNVLGLPLFEVSSALRSVAGWRFGGSR